jgi:hypothetical protein
MVALLAVTYVADAGSAHAYIDPGTGSILLQGIVGGAATFMVVIRLYGSKAKKKFLAIIGRDPANSEHNPNAAE